MRRQIVAGPARRRPETIVDILGAFRETPRRRGGAKENRRLGLAAFSSQLAGLLAHGRACASLSLEARSPKDLTSG